MDDLAMELEFAAGVQAEDIEAVVRLLGDYYRACGGVGLEFQLAGSSSPSSVRVEV